MRMRSRMNENRSCAQRLAHLPDLRIRNVVEPLPQFRLVDVIEPARTEVMIEQREDRPAIHVGTCTPLVMLRTGNLIGGRSGHIGRHIVSRDLAVQRADAVDERRRAQRQRGHVEQRAAAVVVFAEREEALAMLADLAPGAGEVLLDQMKRKRIVSGGHRRVGREHGRALHFFERVVERAALLDDFADALQRDEGGVTLVEVPHRRLNAERAQARARRRCRG